MNQKFYILVTGGFWRIELELPYLLLLMVNL